MPNFDTSLYEPPIVAPVVDSFSKAIRQPDGSSITMSLPEAALPAWCEAANERDARGEYSPLVIGHTIDGAPETLQPPKVGWLTGPFEVTNHEGKPAIVGRHWIRKETELALNGVPVKLSAKDLLDRFPRRSAELWFRDRKIDPVSLLGATTPERELGVLRLDSTQGITASHSLPPLKLSRDTEMPLPDQDHAQTKQFDAMLGSLSQTVQALGQIAAQFSEIAAQFQQPQQGGQEGPLSDDDLSKLLEEHLEEYLGPNKEEEEAPKKKKEKEPEPDAEKEMLKAKLARIEVEKELAQYESKGINFGFSNPQEREQYITDLTAVPADMRARQLNRVKLSRTGVQTSTEFTEAVARAQGSRVPTAADQNAIIQHAAKKSISFNAAAIELGFTPTS